MSLKGACAIGSDWDSRLLDVLMNEPTPLRKVLITGASGYLASFVLRRLRSMFELTLFDRVAPRAEFADLAFIMGDITDAGAVHRACVGQDAVIHLVSLVRERFGMPPGVFADVIVKGTWHVAHACADARVRRLVNISSISVSWPRLQLPTMTLAKEDAPSAPIPASIPPCFTTVDLQYRLSKVLAEKICDAYHDAHGLEVIHLRPGPVVGDGLTAPPGPDDSKYSAGRFFHVDPRDVAQAIQAALTSQTSHGRYAIVAGRTDSLFEWESAAREIGYAPEHNWPEIPEMGLLDAKPSNFREK